MDSKILATMDSEKKSRLAVAFLIANPGERPEGTGKLFEKLAKHEVSMNTMTAKMEEHKQQMQSLHDQLNNVGGAVSAIVELVAEDLPEDKVQEWCEKYELPTQNPGMPGQNEMPNAGNKSMAGAAGKEGAVPPNSVAQPTA